MSYYPFGLTFNSYKRENSLENKIKFQGQEHIDDLDLGWVSFKWRNHMADIGRFFNVDPLADKYVYNSVYAFSENKVIVHVELEGLEAHSLQGEWEEKVINGFRDLMEGTTFKRFNRSFQNVVDENQQKNTPGPTKGMTVTIVGDGPSGEFTSYLPHADEPRDNYVIDKNVVDALMSITKDGPPGSRASNSPGPNEGGQPAPTLQPGEAMRGTAEGASGAVQAGQEVFNGNSNDNTSGINSIEAQTPSVQPNWTNEPKRVEVGRDSVYYTD